MGIDEGNLQVIIDVVDVILESCPLPIVILNLLVYIESCDFIVLIGDP